MCYVIVFCASFKNRCLYDVQPMDVPPYSLQTYPRSKLKVKWNLICPRKASKQSSNLLIRKETFFPQAPGPRVLVIEKVEVCLLLCHDYLVFCIAERLGSRHLLTHFRATGFVDFPQFLSASWFLPIAQMVLVFFSLFFPCFLMFYSWGCLPFPERRQDTTFPGFCRPDEPWLPRLLGGSGSTKACWTGYPFQEMGFWWSKKVWSPWTYDCSCDGVWWFWRLVSLLKH